MTDREPDDPREHEFSEGEDGRIDVEGTVRGRDERGGHGGLQGQGFRFVSVHPLIAGRDERNPSILGGAAAPCQVATDTRSGSF